MLSYSKPDWKPELAADTGWTIAQLQKHLRGQPYTLFRHGTCVVWPNGAPLTDEQSRQTLQRVAQGQPDFKIRKHPDGDLLVTFRGGVGGIMSGQLLKKNFSTLKTQALTQGFLANETLQLPKGEQADEMDLVAGLYIRARLFQDADDLVIVHPLHLRASWRYPEAVQRVEQTCVAFLAHDATIEQVQAALRQSEQEIVALDEKWLRALLCDAENKLEEILHTVSDDQRARTAHDVILHLLRSIQAPRDA